MYKALTQYKQQDLTCILIACPKVWATALPNLTHKLPLCSFSQAVQRRDTTDV